MSEADTEQAVEQVASPAETAGVSPELAAVAGADPRYASILEDMAKENGAEVPRETPEANNEITEETPTEPTEEGENTEIAEEGDKYKLKVKGQEIDVTMDELVALAQKGTRFTQKSQELSSQAKMGLQLELANKGDKAAQKAILEQWNANGQDLDDLVDSLEGVEAKIDTSALEEEALYQQELEQAFDGVDRKSSEFSDVLGVIESEAKGFLPQDLYAKIVDNPANLRQMYDMVSDGSFLQAKNIMSVRLAGMNPSDQATIMSNPKQFGEMFDALWASVASPGSSNQENIQTPTETKTQTQTQQTASPTEEPPSTLSGTKREAQVSTDGDVDFFTDDDAFNKKYRQIKQGY